MYKYINNIKYLEKKPPHPKQMMLVFHGFGADAQDLFPLQEMLPTAIHYVFPEGLLEIPITPWQVGRAWFPIDFSELEAAIRDGNMQALRNRYRDPLQNVARLLKGFILNICKESNLPLLLSGFSQGAMLAMQLACDAELRQHLRGLVLLSTNPSNYEEWLKNMPEIQCPVFISHGRQDPVLPFNFAEQMAQDFGKENTKVEFHAFGGGHEIPLAILKSLNIFLESTIV